MLTIMVSDGVPSAMDLLFLDIDLRLGADTWADLWESGPVDGDRVAALLRVAYGLGYTQALTEGVRGQLFRDHGLAVPKRLRP